MDNELEGLAPLVLWGVCIFAAIVLGAQFVRGWKSAMAEKSGAAAAPDANPSGERDADRAPP